MSDKGMFQHQVIDHDFSLLHKNIMLGVGKASYRRLVPSGLISRRAPLSVLQPQNGLVKLPSIDNEPMKNYAPNSPERSALQQALTKMRSQAPFEVPVVINGKQIKTGQVQQQLIGSTHSKTLCQYHECSPELLNEAINGALKARAKWEAMPFADRASIFLKAADLLSSKYRYELMAATMLGQGKNVWQAEIDAAAELCDFWRFNCQYAAQIYSEQPPRNAQHVWNRVEYRPLEGFVLAVSPFNFTAIGGNLCSAPALMGNVVIWKPAPSAVYSNYLVYKILMEAGLPDGVIQFVPGDAEKIVGSCLNHREFAGLHYTGSTGVFKKLWKQIGQNLDVYRSYPRIVGETGGKNMHFVHKSADVDLVVNQTIRSAFEYQGQKCSACSRAYIPDNLWPEIKRRLVAQMQNVKVGPVDDFANFMCNVVDKRAFDKIKGYIDYIKSSKGAEVIVGGKYDDSEGYFIHPTIAVTKDLKFKTMVEEIFGPVLTIHVYPANEYEKYLKLADETSDYALTCGLFAQDREALVTGSYILRNAAGNLYLNDKSTGAVVGQQPFGGARGSGTNDKAGAALNLYRWVSARTIKETFVPITDFRYPSNMSN